MTNKAKKEKRVNVIKEPLIIDQTGKNRIYKSLSIGQFVEDYFPKLHLPEDIQRREGWSPDRKRSYICSLFAGTASTDLTVVDIQSCKNYTDQTGDVDSSAYFEEIQQKAGIDAEILLDGGHRSRTICGFIEGKIPYTGDVVYQDEEGNFRTQYVRNKKFSNLPQSSQEFFKNKSMISVKQITKSNQQNLHLMFKTMNMISALNHQELRNATMCPLADSVRDTSKQDRSYANNGGFSILKSIPTINNHHRMKDDEFVAQLYTWEQNGVGSDLSHEKTDELYDAALSVDEVNELSSGVQNKMELLRDVLGEQSNKKKTRPKTFGFLIYLSILEERFGIMTDEIAADLDVAYDLFDEFHRSDEKLMKKARRDLAEDLLLSESDTYLYTRRQVCHPKTLKLWKSKLEKEISTSLVLRNHFPERAAA